MTSQLINTSGTILINKNIEFVFDFFANPGNDHLWRNEINKSELNGALSLGVIIDEYSNLSKKAPNNLLQLKCIGFEKSKIAVFETIENSPFYLISKRQVKFITKNTTEVSYSLSFDKNIVKFALGFALPKFIIALKAGGDMKKYLNHLKSALENT